MQSTEIFAELMRFNGVYVPRLFKGFPEDIFYIKPENRGNPLIWILGHLVLNRGEIVEILGGNPRTSDLGDYYARGTFPETDPAKNQTPDELLKRWTKLVALTEHLIVNADPILMDQKSWGQFESLGQNLAYSYMHETHHIGQMVYILSLPSVKNKKPSSTQFRKPDQKNSTTKIILESIKSVFT